MAGTAMNRDNTPQNGMQGSSYLYDMGTSPNTRTVVSQKIRILTPSYGGGNTMNQMGVISQFAPTMSRSVDPIRGIGHGDKIAELVPSVSEPITGNLERALLYLSNLWQATGYAAGIDGPVRSLAHHRWPFDMEQQIVFSTLADNDLQVANSGTSLTGFQGGVKSVAYGKVSQPTGDQTGSDPGHTALITIYEACWFTSWNATFAKDSGFVMESGDVTVSDVHDFSSMYGEFLATGNDPTIGQLGSIRFTDGSQFAGRGGEGSGGAVPARFVTG